MNTHHSAGLKIPVSAVRFRPRALGNHGKTSETGSAPSASRGAKNTWRVPAGCQLLVAALLFLFAGCARSEKPHCGGVYHFHTSLPQEFRADVSNGVAGWNAFSGQAVVIEGESDEVECSVRSIPWGGPEYQAIKSDFGKDFMGYSYGEDGSIIITEGDYTRSCVGNLGSTCLAGTIEHELGHANGMQHIDGGAVMNPDTVRTDFTTLDLAECKRAGACS